MQVFEEYVSNISHPELKQRMQDILQWISDTFPQLEPRIAWNQPMFTDHGTFIIDLASQNTTFLLRQKEKGLITFQQILYKLVMTMEKDVSDERKLTS